jgi:hypothetical protein
MKSALFTIVFFSLFAAGCYTQVGSTRDDRFSGEYDDEDSAVVEESPSTDATVTEDVDPYFDENGYPRERWYLGDNSTVVVLGAGWYDPWYYRPWYDDPFWCWNPSPAYYSPWWYPAWSYPEYGWYGGGYGGGYGHHGRGGLATRTIGTTRGTGRGRTLGSPRGGSDAGVRQSPTMMDLPTGARTGSGSRPNAGVTGGKTGRKAETVQSGGTSTPPRSVQRSRPVSGGRSREATRPASPRRPARESTSTPAPTYTPGQPSQGGGRPAVSTPPPASRPSGGGESGTRGSGSTRGGGGGRR